jgi:diacylglycerol kinase family enzyme
MAAYVATTLRLMSELRSTEHVITIDGVTHSAWATMVLVANCGEVIPPFVRLGAGIRPDDGLLDVVVVRANNFGQSVRAVWDILRSAPQIEGVDGYVRYARGREIRVETDPVQPVQLDGEAGGETPFTVTVVPRAIRILVPGGKGRFGSEAGTD